MTGTTCIVSRGITQAWLWPAIYFSKFGGFRNRWSQDIYSCLVLNIMKQCRNKKCRNFGKFLDVKNFCKSSKAKDGLQTWCKECVAKRKKQLRDKNLEHYRKKGREHSASRRTRSRDEINRKKRERRKKNPDQAKQTDKKNRVKYKKTIMACVYKWKSEHKDRVKVLEALSSKRHPERGVNNTAKRRARIKGSSEASLTTQEILLLKKNSGFRCAYCEKKFTSKELTIDHINPISRGGAHALWNVVVSCDTCNKKKGTKKNLVPVQPFLILFE